MKAHLLVVQGLLLVSSCAAPAPHPLPPPPAPLSSASLAPWRQPPTSQLQEEVPLRLAVAQFRLQNGLRINVLPRPGTTTTAIGLRIPSLHDGRQGPASVLADMLRAGTLTPQGKDLVDPRLSDVPIAISTERTGTSLTWEVLPRASERALELLAAFVLSPTFDESELVGQFARHEARFQGRAGLRRLGQAAIPGLELPVSRNGFYFHWDEIPSDQLTPAVLRMLHRCMIQPTDAQLVVVGPVEPELVRRWAQSSFGRWLSSGNTGCGTWQRPLTTSHPDESRFSDALIQVIPGGSDLAAVNAYVSGPAIDSPEYLAFEVLARLIEERVRRANLLGGNESTLQIRNLYGFPQLSLLEVEGYAERGYLVDQIRGLLELLHQVPESITDAELEMTKSVARTGFVEALSTNDSLVEAVFWQLQRQRAVAELAELPGEVMRIDVALIRNVAARWLRHAHASIVVNGTRAVQLSALNAECDVLELPFSIPPAPPSLPSPAARRSRSTTAGAAHSAPALPFDDPASCRDKLPSADEWPENPGKPKLASRRGDSAGVTGRLSPEVIRSVVRAHYSDLRKCYDDGLGRHPTLRGKVEIRFAIGRDGKVDMASAADGDLPDCVVWQCLRDGFLQLEFPHPEGGTVTVSYPIRFEPG